MNISLFASGGRLCPPCFALGFISAFLFAGSPVSAQSLRHRVGDFLGENDFPPIVPAGESRALTSDILRRWSEWREENLIKPAQQYLSKSHPDKAEAWMKLVRRAAERHFSHPEDPAREAAIRSEDPAAFWEMSRLAGEILDSNPTEAFVTYAAIMDKIGNKTGDRERLVKAMESLPSPMVRFLIERVRSRSGSLMPTDAPPGKSPSAVRAAAAALKDGPPLSDADAEMFHGFLEEQISSDNVKNHPGDVEALVASPRLPEWLACTLRGNLHVRKGWLARGGGWSSTVTQAGWEGFFTELRAARDLFTKAWKLKPEVPYAAAEMITVAATVEDGSAGNMREWFDRAVAARFDYFPAYGSLTWFLRPRWGGSVGKMAAFALACTDTGRFDTEVPRRSLRILRDVIEEIGGQWQQLYHDPLISEAIVAMGEGYLAKASTPEARRAEQCRLIATAWLFNQKGKAAEGLAAMSEPLTFEAADMLAKHGLTERVVREEAALHTVGALPDFERARAFYEKRQLDEAEPILQKIKSANAASPPAPVTRLLSAIEFEREFAKGDWVKLKITPGLENWEQTGGKWTVADDGALEIAGPQNKPGMLYNGRTGAEIEMRGECVLEAGQQSSCGICVVANRGVRDSVLQSLGCSATLMSAKEKLDGWLSEDVSGGSTRPEGRVAVPGAKQSPQKLKFTITLKGGKATYVLNDTVIASEGVFVRQSPRRAELQPAEDGRVGLAWHTLPEGSKVRLLSLEVRNLTGK